MFSFLKVDPKTIPEDVARRMKRDLFLKYDEYPAYFERKPTVQEGQAFRHWLDAQTTTGDNRSTNIESAAIQAQITPVWNGTVLTVADKKWQFSPVPHTYGMEIEPSDRIVVTVATMMLRVNDDKVVEPSIAPEVTKTGPLASVMTPSSYADYVALLGPYLQEHGLVNMKEERFAMELYEHLARLDKNEVSALRWWTYCLFSKSKLRYDPARQAVVSDRRFKYEHGPVSVLKNEDGVVTHYVPRSHLEKLDMQIEVLPSAQKKEKDAASAMLSQLQSRFPARLTKYYGFRGFPDKNQRYYLDLCPFLTVARPCDPSVMTEKWMKANGYESHIRYSGDSLVSSTIREEDVLLVNRPYTDSLNVKKNCILYGQVTFSKAFWAGYKILMYRPTCSGKFFYAPADFDIKGLPKDYCDWPLTVISSASLFVQFYKAFAAELLTLLIRGSFGPRGKLYAHLKYPIELKEYMVVSMTEVADLDDFEFKDEKFVDELTMTQVALEGNEEDKPLEKRPRPQQWIPEEYSPQMIFRYVDDFDSFPEEPPFRRLLFPRARDWKTVDDDEVNGVCYILYNGGRHIIWGVTGDDDDIWVVGMPQDVQASLRWIQKQLDVGTVVTKAVLEYDG